MGRGEEQRGYGRRQYSNALGFLEKKASIEGQGISLPRLYAKAFVWNITNTLAH